MNAFSTFQVAGGSVRGTLHRAAERNNQDGFAWQVRDEAIVAVVTDGCGSHPHSEAGALLGAPLVVRAALSTVQEEGLGEDATLFLHSLRDRLFAELLHLSRALGEDAETVYDRLLFTVVGAVLTPDRTLVFACGDGYWNVNGEGHLEEAEGNEPPYPAYGVLHRPEPRPRFNLELGLDRPTEEVQSLLLATDGIRHWLGAEDRPVPGTDEPIGPLSQFWTDPSYHENPDGVRRRLARVNQEQMRVDWETRRVHRSRGPLSDDTTLVVLRRAPAREPEDLVLPKGE